MISPPIAQTPLGKPIAYACLGACFHLEHLEAADVPRLAAAHQLVDDAIGADLRFTWSSVHGHVEAYRPGDLALATEYPTLLANPEKHADERAQRGASILAAESVDRFGLVLHGGTTRNEASPIGYRFYARIPNPGVGAWFPAKAQLSFTLPLDAPLDAFRRLAFGVASALRLRWGSAGLGYATAEGDHYGAARAAVHAHARRYPGFDVGQHATLMTPLHDRLRSVSHLTFVGPALAAGLERRGVALRDGDGLAMAKAGEAIVLRAGEKPEAGDVNDRHVPPAYARADALVRSIRLADAHFFAPWTQSGTAAWLARFEPQASPA